MGRPSQDFDLLLRAPHPVEAELARGLLEEQGIPALLHGGDFDVAELGSVSHAMLRRPDLYVPKGTRARALEVLREGGYEEPIALEEDEPPAQAGGASSLSWLAVLVLLGVVAPLVFACIDLFRNL
jgi:hypothetical protein